MKKLTAIIVLAMVSIAAISCTKSNISRDHIPVLRDKLYQLQVAVAAQNRAAMDSLLSVEMLDYDQNSDSLLNLVYGQDRSFPFTQFGNAEIFYTRDKARVDCYMMDSTRSDSRPISFTLTFDNGIWLFKRFQQGHPRNIVSDSIDPLA